jgi:hypothetical protein
MNELIYEVPLERVPDYRDKRLIVRTREPALLPLALVEEDFSRLIAIQILSLDPESEVLNAWAPGLPVELVASDAADFPLLYRHTNLLDHHPVRVAIPLQSGFSKAVKAAVSLDFAVRLEPGQPDPVLIEELAATLEFYLHQSTVAQPVEFFHSTLLGFYHDDPAPLWVVLDADPLSLRHVADDGVEDLPGRLEGVEVALAPDAGLEVWIEQVLVAAEECRTCQFLASCGGYFKWPRSSYDCAGVKRVFGLLRDAAAELRRDLDEGPA